MQEPVYVLYLITCHGRIMPRLVELLFFNSPELEVLMVSYCGQSMSVVRRPSSVVRRQQLL